MAGWILELDRGEGIPWEGNYSSWLDQKSKRLGLTRETSFKKKKNFRERVGMGTNDSKGKAHKI